MKVPLMRGAEIQTMDSMLNKSEQGLFIAVNFGTLPDFCFFISVVYMHCFCLFGYLLRRCNVLASNKLWYL
jgi:hypothetical protein